MDGEVVEPDEDYDPPKTLTEALFRLDPEEIFFHLSNGVHAGCPDPWEYSIHDYQVISHFWGTKFPPPHMVAGCFVETKSNTDEGGEPRKRNAKKLQGFDKRAAYQESLSMLSTDPMLTGTVMKGKADPKQRNRLDHLWSVVSQMNEGKTLDQIDI